MKATSDFSWRKILSFFGAGLAVFFAFVNGGSAGILIKSGNGFNGVCSIFSAIGWLCVAFAIYKSYEKWDAAGKPGVKLEDVKEKKK